MAKGDRITTAAYNNLQSIASLVMGANAGGYGQFLYSSQASTNTVITAAQWNALRNDMSRAYLHITGNSAQDTLAIVNLNPPHLQLIGSSTVISDAILTQYTNFANYINTNKATVHPTQETPNVGITSTVRSTAWGNSIDVVSHTITVTFNGYTQNGGAFTVTSDNHPRYFFNAGGKITISGSFVPTIDPPPASSKNELWKNLMSQFGTISFANTSTSASGGFNNQTATSTEAGPSGTSDSTPAGVNSSFGFNNLVVGNTTWNQIFRSTGVAGKYVENDYIIKVRRPTNNTLEFIITFRDDDAGDQTGIGGPVDEDLSGTLTSIVRCTRPSGTAPNVDVPAPLGTSTPIQ